MPERLHIDVETFSSVPISAAGAYKYTKSFDFEILLVAYAFDHDPVNVIDLAQGEELPDEFIKALKDREIKKCAHNATFERYSFDAYGYTVPIDQWMCSAIKASNCGLPLKLDEVSKILKLEEKGKLSTGNALIKYFSVPCKPTKKNGQRTRNFPHHDIEKWNEFKRYNKNDVEAEREIFNILKKYKTTETEKKYYIIDQEINDRGVLIDLNLANNAVKFDNKFSSEVIEQIKEVSNIENPNSPAQLKNWLSCAFGKEIKSLAKENVIELIKEVKSGAIDEMSGFEILDKDYASKMSDYQKEKLLLEEGYTDFFGGEWVDLKKVEDPYRAGGCPTDDLVNIILNRRNKIEKKYSVSDVLTVLEGRQKISRSSTKKYLSMINCACDGDRGHGLFQFYGAGRTGRWAGRIVQLQNLPRNEMDDLELARDIVLSGDYDLAKILYDNIPKVLSELIRTALIAPKGQVFTVADFSAIEARVLSWIADEEWRLEVFRTHGKIYEASAALMFNVPLESITKGSELRQRGKTAELALGYQGGTSAMDRMDKDNKIPKSEYKFIVEKWREANPKIVQFWYDIDKCAKYTIKTGKSCRLRSLSFHRDKNTFQIQLPSGRRLFYHHPGIGLNRFRLESITFEGMDQDTKKWGVIETYGGKLTENVIQAISRDLLANSMAEVRDAGKKIVMHVHDEMVNEGEEKHAKSDLKFLIDTMSKDVSWAPGLPLSADGYITKFYKKA